MPVHLSLIHISQCVSYLASFGITDTTQIHKLYLQLLEEPGNYLKYYLGYLEICKLKESALALSSNWSLYDFHKMCIRDRHTCP